MQSLTFDVGSGVRSHHTQVRAGGEESSNAPSGDGARPGDEYAPARKIESEECGHVRPARLMNTWPLSTVTSKVSKSGPDGATGSRSMVTRHVPVTRENTCL